jgi:hypothetical protein
MNLVTLENVSKEYSERQLLAVKSELESILERWVELGDIGKGD